MSLTWNAATPPDIPPRGPVQWLRVALRGVTLVFCTYFGMIFVIAFNLVERWLPLGIAIRDHPPVGLAGSDTLRAEAAAARACR